MRRTLTRLLPPTWLVAAALLLYLPHWVAYGLIALNLGVGWSEFRPMLEAMLSYVAMLAVAYGAWRAIYFHPLPRENYSAWLASTPWSVGRPLPMGPVQLVWQDAFVVLPLVLLGEVHRQDGALVVWCWFTIAYVVSLALLAAAAGHRGWSYSIWILLFALAPAWHWPLAALAVTVLLHLAGRGALVASLRSFPWAANKAVEKLRSYSPEARAKKTPVGWPLDRVGPRVSSSLRISTLDALAISALVAWSFFAAFWPLVRQGVHWDDMGSTFAASLLMIGAIVVRTAIYFYGGLWPPISLAGRILTGRLLIPGYDRALIAPLLMALIAWFALRTIDGPGMAALAAQAATVFVVYLIGLGLGPRYRDWVLTAPGRIVHAALSDGPLKRI